MPLRRQVAWFPRQIFGQKSEQRLPVAAQGRATALFNGRHDLELTQAQMTALRLPPGRSMALGQPLGAEDIGHLQGVASLGCCLGSSRVL